MQTRRLEKKPRNRDNGQVPPGVPARLPTSPGAGPAADRLSGPVLKTGSVFELGTDVYSVVSPFEHPSGESELFILERGGKRFVLKHYFPHVRPKQEVLSTLAEIRHDYIVSPVEFGTLGNRFFEVLPLVEGGSLANRLPVRDADSLSRIAARVTEALAYCHRRGILHRDIKPENLLVTGSRAWEVAVSDFGIASLLREDQTRHLTSQAFTFGYAAPELFGFGGRVYVGKEADYYALGMTLLHLWEGRNPFEGLSAYAISNLTTSGNIRIPSDMPQVVSDLVHGLTTLDYRMRWGEKEVGDRLRGAAVPIQRRTAHAKSKPFIFDTGAGETFSANTPVEAAALMERFPEMGIKHLYRKTLAEWLFSADPPLFQKITDLVDTEYPEDENAGLCKAILLLDPSRPFRSSRGKECLTPEEIGAELDEDYRFYRKELAENPSSELYLFLEARGYGEAADIFRSYFTTHTAAKAFNLIVLALLGEDTFRLGPLCIRTTGDVNEAPEFVREYLMDALWEDDSRFLVWLERRGILSSSKGLQDPEVRAEIFGVFPWAGVLFSAEGYDAPDESDRYGYTALHRAVVAGESVKVRRLLRAGGSPDCVQSSGWTALHLASRYNRTEICRLLMECGADPDAVTRSGDTPLHVACRSDAAETVQCLLELGARTDRRNSEGFSPAALAVRSGNLQAARSVLACGGKIGRKELQLLRKAGLPVLREPRNDSSCGDFPEEESLRRDLERLLEEEAVSSSRKTVRRVLFLLLPFLMLLSLALVVHLEGGRRIVPAVFFVSLGFSLYYLRKHR